MNQQQKTYLEKRMYAIRGDKEREIDKECSDIVTNAGLSQDTNIDELKTQFQKNFVNECVQFLAVIVRYIEWGNREEENE